MGSDLEKMAGHLASGECLSFLMAVKGAGAAARLMTRRDYPLDDWGRQTSPAEWTIAVLQLEMTKR